MPKRIIAFVSEQDKSVVTGDFDGQILPVIFCDTLKEFADFVEENPEDIFSYSANLSDQFSEDLIKKLIPLMTEMIV